MQILEENEKKPKRESLTTKYNKIAHLTNVARKKLKLEKNHQKQEQLKIISKNHSDC